MARFATFILNSDLESLAIKAILAQNGELATRAVDYAQLSALESEIIVISDRKLAIQNPYKLVDLSMDFESISQLLAPSFEKPIQHFDKQGGKLICFVGLSGGVGTTSIAINYAFELAHHGEVALFDLDQRYPEIAQNLGLHHIEERTERIGQQLQISQGITNQSKSDFYVADLGSELDHWILSQADLIYVISRLNPNTFNRIQELSFSGFNLICNFVERSKIQLTWLKRIEAEFPRLHISTIPYEPKSFELAAERKSALVEVSPNSLARKLIATLG